MHTVCELTSFRKAAEAAGMSNEEIEDLIRYLADNPAAGDEIKGTGGCRKIRVGLKKNNKGKSGGARTITFYTGEDLPVFLLTVFAKNKKVNLKKDERNKLKALTQKIVKEYEKRVLPISLASGDR